MPAKTTNQTPPNSRDGVASPNKEQLPRERLLDIYRCMARARAMEERMIKMSKSGEGYFWIGGPGEEAFNVALGMQVKKGQGPDFDYLHLHYRNGACVLAMEMSMLDIVRQIAMTATDPNSRGRNFPGHFSKKAWNIVPVSSVIEIQYTMAPGTAQVQKRHGGDGISIVLGGDAGSAEGDFASCLIWSSRPENELPVLIVVTNNSFGISTPYNQVHAEKNIIDRGKAFGIPGEVVDGNDPVASWFAIERAMNYCRTQRKPFLLEAMVSRLHGHSSSSGALRVESEPDCLDLFGRKLLQHGHADEKTLLKIREEAQNEADDAADTAASEEKPQAQDIYLHTYADSDVDAVYPGDYTDLPE